MVFDLNTIEKSIEGASMGPIWAMFIGFGIAIALILIFGVYIYFVLAWRKIAKKMKYKKSWLAWIPFANIAMWLQMGGFHWAWIFLMLVPIVGWLVILVLFIIATWRVFEKLKYPGWLSLALIIDVIPGIRGLGMIAYGIVIGIVAWKK